MRKIIALSVVLFASAWCLNAQTVEGLVKDDKGAGLEKSTVSLLKAADSSVIKFGITNAAGHYSFAATPGKYLVSVSFVGYQPSYSASFELADGEQKKLSDLILMKAAQSLQGVTVSAKKPMVEVRADKTIVNVEGTINAVGNDALELLRRSPGITIDKDDNISLAGKNGVQIYIDGKPSPLSSADLAAYLKSMQSSQIEAIELITNPSAKYEAAGNAGIINIRLKKDKTVGTNGSVAAGYRIGIHSSYNGSVSLNHRNKKMNVFGNYTYANNEMQNEFTLYRNQFDTLFDQTSIMRNHFKNHNFKTGVDFFLTKKATLGAMINGNVSEGDMITKGPMNIIHKPTNELVRILRANNTNDRENKNMNFNLNYRYVGTKGNELNLDADYGFFDINSNQFQPNYYYDKDGSTLLYSNIYRMISPTNIDIFSIKGDYEQNYQKGRLGYGGKLGYVRTDNDFRRYDVEGSSETLDKERSNRFDYKENVNAAYVNYNRPFKGFMIQAGVRVENTLSRGISIGQKWDDGSGSYRNYDSTIKREYTDFFPSAAITFNKNPEKQLGFSYSRRIDRPVYQDLNPFEFKLNDYTYMKGNTNLRPQYTNSFGANFTYKYKLVTALNYSHVKDMFAQVPDTIEKSKGFLTKKNLATQDIVSLNVSYPFQYKAYSFFANANTSYSLYKADFGGGNRVVNQDVFTFTFFMQNSLKFAKTWTAELSGFYNSPTIWQGFFRSIAMYSMDAGLGKTIFKGKGNVKVAVSDVFKTMKFKGESNFSGVSSTASGHWESRQLRLNLTYRFGSAQIKAARQRKTGLDDESKRASGGGSSPAPGGQ